MERRRAWPPATCDRPSLVLLLAYSSNPNAAPHGTCHIAPRAVTSMALTHQLHVLAALDRAKTQRYHLLAAVIAGTGFFAGAYNLYAVSLVNSLLSRVYFADSAAGPPDAAAAASLNASMYRGTLVGHLFFGWLGDAIGRRRAYGLALALVAACSAASGLSFGHTAKAVVATLCFFRFWLGVGAGGGYPLSAAIMAEYASKRKRGSFLAAVHATQGVAIAACNAVVLVVSAVVTGAEADYMWRVILVTGVVPATVALYLRTKLPETARHTALVAGDPKTAAADMSRVLCATIQEQEPSVSVDSVDDKWGLFSVRFMRSHGLHILATSSAWFLLDLTYYSQSILQKDLLSKLGWVSASPAVATTTMDAVEEVSRLARAQALIALCGAVPGYVVSVFLIDVVGRRRLQVAGFMAMTLSMLALATLYEHWASHDVAGFMALYNVAFFFANAGPNTTTFVAPAELFPARLRCTCHGVAAAAGRAGAVLGSFGFYPRKGAGGENAAGIGARNELFVLAGTNFLGMLMTLFVPETSGASLEVISKEIVYEAVDIAGYN
ncbi:hypothetical protein HU200_047308 [Digitaria exilis]|uniref:H(+)/Pi cotransporter n=1 Tax=Digitaria exilis TaxID=1010633 RepID=A0A835EDV4_9POAL|nr:hypothetical protein HU200_047308 [Digitaria exilis]